MVRQSLCAAVPDRPDDKLLEHGPGSLSDAELLVVLWQPGARIDAAIASAQALLARFSDFAGLGGAGIGEVRAIRGIGRSRAAQLLAALEIARRYGQREFKPGAPFRSSRDVYLHFREHLGSAPREHFIAVLLDNKHRKIKEVQVSQGSLTASIVHPRDVFVPVVREAAAAVVFVHNHPSGDPTPSREDLEITRRLRDVGDLVGVRVLDHIVVGHGCYVSFVDDGYW